MANPEDLEGTGPKDEMEMTPSKLCDSTRELRKKADVVRLSLVSLVNPIERKDLWSDKISYGPSLAITDKLRGSVYKSRFYLPFTTVSSTAWHIVGIH